MTTGTGAWSAEARAKRKATVEKLVAEGKWNKHVKGKKKKKHKGPPKLKDGTFITWSPEARKKRAATLKAKRLAAASNGKSNGKHLPAVSHIPLDIFPDRPVKRLPAEKRAYVKQSSIVDDYQKLALANRVIGLLENILGR